MARNRNVEAGVVDAERTQGAFVDEGFQPMECLRTRNVEMGLKLPARNPVVHVEMVRKELLNLLALKRAVSTHAAADKDGIVQAVAQLCAGGESDAPDTDVRCSNPLVKRLWLAFPPVLVGLFQRQREAERADAIDFQAVSVKKRFAEHLPEGSQHALDVGLLHRAASGDGLCQLVRRDGGLIVGHNADRLTSFCQFFVVQRSTQDGLIENLPALLGLG